MSNSTVKLGLVQKEDYKTLAYLEAIAFQDEFTDLAYGTHRAEDEALETRAKEIEKRSDKPGEKVKMVKAVRGRDGREELVGFASWVTVRVGEGGVGVYGAEKGDEVIVKNERKQDKRENEGGKREGNEKLCEDLFIPGDQFMAKACGGGDYHKLYCLVVSPDCQRQGIGSLLLEDGLREADEAGLQCVLGASPEGLGLYKKHGFVEFENMSLNLGEYEGGEGMGVVKHCIMHRPAKSS